MTKTPTDLDAILDSIRARMTEEVAPIIAAPLADLPKKPAKLLATGAMDSTGATVDAVFAAVLEPLLRQWIDANLPEICERIAQQEIRRLTGQI